MATMFLPRFSVRWWGQPPHPTRAMNLTRTGAQVREALEQSAVNQKPERLEDRVRGLIKAAGMRWTSVGFQGGRCLRRTIKMAGFIIALRTRLIMHLAADIYQEVSMGRSNRISHKERHRETRVHSDMISKAAMAVKAVRRQKLLGWRRRVDPIIYYDYLAYLVWYVSLCKVNNLIIPSFVYTSSLAHDER